jgi:HJR/Mrr/RecB family endonuclease
MHKVLAIDTLILIAVVFILTFAISKQSPAVTTLIFILITIPIVGFIYVIAKGKEFNRKKEIERRKLKAIENEKKHAEYIILVKERLQLLITQHIGTLSLKRDHTVSQDDYGNYLFNKWFEEIDYFIDNVLRKDELISRYLMDSSIDIFRQAGVDTMDELRNKRLSEIKELLIQTVQDYKAEQTESNPHLAIDIENLSPIEFEHFCAEILRKNDWDARVTQISGDQGIDIIAKHGNIKVVIQCKKLSHPVGNSAVQEIIAGKQYERADIAVVVSNNTFTPSAKQLARVTDVYLLHYTELDYFASHAKNI